MGLKLKNLNSRSRRNARRKAKKIEAGVTGPSQTYRPTKEYVELLADLKSDVTPR